MTTTTTSRSSLDTGRLERVLRVRNEHPRESPRADGAAAVRPQDAERHRVRADPSGARPHDVPVDRLLCLARLFARQEDGPQRRLRAALRDQRAAYVRRHLRHHAAHRASTGDPIKGWEAGLVWVFFQSFILMLGGFIAPFIRKVTPRAALLGTLAGVSVAFISMRPAMEIFLTPGDRPRVPRHHPRELVRRACAIRAASRPGLVAVAFGIVVGLGSRPPSVSTSAA